MSASTGQLAKFCAEADYAALPSSAIDKIKNVLLDSIGCALGACVTDRARIALEFVGESGGKPQASIIGNYKSSCELAAFANGELINSLDYDPLGPISFHISPYVVPSCLVMAERVHASGKELITALAIAHEVAGRVAGSVCQHRLSTSNPPYYKESPRFSYTTSVFGATAGACKLACLDKERIANALGIAGASTPVPAGLKWEHSSDSHCMVKYNAWAGWIAQLGTVAALLAEKGFTGDKTILDGKWGFWKIYGSPFFNQEFLLDKLGKVWHIDEIQFKPYPTCGLQHSAIDAINMLMQKNNIEPGAIERLLVKGDRQYLTANRVGIEVKSFADTQFRNAYILAIAVYYGTKPGPVWQIPSTYNDPKIRELMTKIEVEIDPGIERLVASKVKAGGTTVHLGTSVEIASKGQKYIAEVTNPKGSPANPMTQHELEEKFRNNACYSFVKSRNVEEAIVAVRNLEDIADITELTELFVISS